MPTRRSRRKDIVKYTVTLQYPPGMCDGHFETCTLWVRLKRCRTRDLTLARAAMLARRQCFRLNEYEWDDPEKDDDEFAYGRRGSELKVLSIVRGHVLAEVKEDNEL